MLKTAVCYFSGSGNSFYVALELSKYINIHSAYYIPNFDISKLHDYDEIIIVTPVYSLNIPKIVQDFIRRLKFEGRFYVVLCSAGMFGGSARHVKRLFRQCHLNLGCIKRVIMPSSHSTVGFTPRFLAKAIISIASGQIKRAANNISKNENKNLKLRRVGKIKRYVGYSAFSAHLSVSDSCTKCGECAKICPTKNIKESHGTIVFSDRCIACHACYNRCEAILYRGFKGKTYVNPYVDFKAMR
ncbi:MAG: EFR1 family ferrodoxin [Clostridia bacterium]|nr:EFR1 family ferrodoxin [Clostridia bacterium]